MAWDEHITVDATVTTGEGAFKLTYTKNFIDYAFALSTTSTSTIALKDGSDLLRMYSITNRDLLNAFGTQGVEVMGIDFTDPTRLPTSVPTDDGNVIRWIECVDSDTSQDFVVNIADTPVLRTCIPALRYVSDWRYTVVTGSTEQGDGSWQVETEEARADFVVLYKDPHVIAVPSTLGGGYLILMGRYRALASDVLAAWSQS